MSIDTQTSIWIASFPGPSTCLGPEYNVQWPHCFYSGKSTPISPAPWLWWLLWFTALHRTRTHKDRTWQSVNNTVSWVEFKSHKLNIEIQLLQKKIIMYNNHIHANLQYREWIL